MKKGILLLFIVLAQLIIGITAHAQTTTIFDYGSTWRYLDNGSDQGTAWRTSAFNDATWAQATGIFGYGDPWITACVKGCAATACGSSGCTAKFITTYFRKTINIADVNMYTGIRLSTWRDDGIVVYVNGVEVWKDNMPVSVNYLTNSTTTIDAANENTPITSVIPMSAFINGNNVIAVEMHQRDANSSDLTFNMQAVGLVNTAIFNFGSSWKYFAGSDQGTTWRASGFNDLAWPSGTGHIGFGETWTTTCIPAGPTGCTAGCTPGSCTKYPTTYFRKTINLSDLSFFDSVRFSVFRDDGIVMYVNGTEVWRNNLPTGTISYSSQAPNNVNGATGIYAESLAVVQSIPISAFTTGTNVIAIELHQNSATSSDADFNVQATGVIRVPPVPVTLVQGPYLQMGNQTAVSVRWRTGVASKSRVMAGTVYGTYPIVVNDAAALTDHELRFTGLTPDTKYYYRFGTDTSVLQGDTTNFFVTAPAETSDRRVTIAVFGDCGRNDNTFQTSTLSSYQSFLTANGMKAADIMQLVGDNAYNSGTEAEFSSGFFAPYSTSILKNHMLFPLPGNHDYENGSAARQADHNMPYYSLFTMPAAGECGGVPSGTEAYYSYDWGANVHVLSLDSYGKENAGTTRLYDTLGAQVNWIKADLAANTKKWVIVLFHHPPYTMGSHTSDGEAELVNIRQNFIRILERYGVDLLITGHSHDYERSYLMKGHFGAEASFNKAAHTTDSSSAKYDGTTNSCPYNYPSGKQNHGTVYVVSGSAGADGGVQSGYPHNALPFSIDDGGMFFLDIKDNRLDAKFIRRNSTIGDQFTIMKDVKASDTIEILHGESVNLSATWPGNYTWAPGVTTRSVTVTPAADTVIEVKDNVTGTCLTDRHFIDLQCTTPDITVSPSDITRDGCHAVVTYAVSDTGRPSPALSYTFTGATTGTGNGTGSGATFNVGVTTVTLSAANECGTANRSFTVTIQPLPTAYTVTGTGSYCAGGAGLPIGLSNSQTGVSYQLYNDATTIGTSLAGNTGTAINFGTLTATATYSVLATDGTTGCTKAMSGTAIVSINPLPAIQAVSGGGNYCDGGTGISVGLNSSQTGINYRLYNGSTPVGSIVTGTGSGISFGTYTTTGTYTVSATNATTSCINNMSGSAAIGINPLPIVHNVIGGGSYCIGGTGLAVGLDNTNTGINYQAFNATGAVSGMVSGTGSSLGMGTFTSADDYTIVATNATTGCASNMAGSTTISIDPLPAAYMVTGGGNYCAGGTGVAIGVLSSETGVNYMLYNGSSSIGIPVAGTGTAASFGAQTMTGTYAVTAMNTTTGCVNTMAGIATIGINDLPSVYAVTGGGSFCAGGTGVHIGLGGSATGIEYQLFNGSTALGLPITGTGFPMDLGLQTTAGTYTVSAINTTTACSNNMSGSASTIVTPLVTPSVTVSSDAGADVCAGTSVSYNALSINGGLTPAYSWTVNGLPVASTSPSYTYVPSNLDVVSVQLGSSIACVTATTATAAMSMTVRPMVMPSAAITVTPDDTLCEGIPVTYTATTTNGGPAPVIAWLKNSAIVGTATTYTHTPDNGDGIVLTLSSNAPCRLADNVYSNIITMQVDEARIPMVSLSAIPGIYISRGQVVTFTANISDAGAAPGYKWLKNGIVIPGATLSTYNTSALADKDSISCIVTASGECGMTGFNSIRMNVTTVGINETDRSNSISVLPNPTSGDFVIQGSTGSITDGTISISVTNMLGQSVYSGNIQSTGGKINERVALGNHLAEGMYLLNISTAAGKEVFHIILKR